MNGSMILNDSYNCILAILITSRMLSVFREGIQHSLLHNKRKRNLSMHIFTVTIVKLCIDKVVFLVLHYYVFEKHSVDTTP
jgi:hypothetical protein